MNNIRSGHRWSLAILMSGGVVVSYLDRVNLSHAIIPISGELSLSPYRQGMLLSAFSWGYVLFMLFGGVIVDRFGPFRAVAVGASIWSLATAWTGISSSYMSLLFSRVLIGISEAPIFPANARLVRENFPLQERGRATALFDSGSYIGIAISAPIVVPVIVYFGWRRSFLVCAILGFVWVALWIALAPNLGNLSPDTDRSAVRLTPSSLWALMRHRTILGTSLGFFCYNYHKNFFLTWLPAFLIQDRGVNFLSIGILGAVPPLFALLGDVMGGFTTDQLVRRGFGLTLARKLPICLGLTVGSLICLTSAIGPTWAIVILLSITFAGTIAASPAIWAIPGDIAPTSNLVGTIGGLQNTVSNIAGIVAPVITGALVGRFDSFTPALVLSGLVACLGALSYWLLAGRIEPIELG